MYTQTVIPEIVLWYCPILLTCQMQADYTISAHDVFGSVRQTWGH